MKKVIKNSKKKQKHINPLNPMSDNGRVSLHNINTTSSRQVKRTEKNKYQLGDFSLPKTKSSQNGIMRIV